MYKFSSKFMRLRSELGKIIYCLFIVYHMDTNTTYIIYFLYANFTFIVYKQNDDIARHKD